jgi:hypothetical protein
MLVRTIPPTNIPFFLIFLLPIMLPINILIPVIIIITGVIVSSDTFVYVNIIANIIKKTKLPNIDIIVPFNICFSNLLFVLSIIFSSSLDFILLYLILWIFFYFRTFLYF